MPNGLNSNLFRESEITFKKHVVLVSILEGSNQHKMMDGHVKRTFSIVFLIFSHIL